MTPYEQDDSKWANVKYYGNYTIGKYGCFLVSLSMMIDKEPPETAQILRDNGCFTSGGYLSSECASVALGIEYGGKTTDENEAKKFVGL